MGRLAGGKNIQATYSGWRQFLTLFLAPWLGFMLPLVALGAYTADSLTSGIQANSIGTARESLLERKRIFFESVQSIKRASYEIAHNPDAVKLITLSASDIQPDQAARQLELIGSVRNYAHRLIRELDMYESIFYLDMAGAPVYSLDSTELLAAVEPTAAGFFASAAQGNIALDGPFTVGIDERMVVVAASPAYDESNRHAGVAGIVISAARFFSPLVSPRSPSPLRYGVLDQNGFIMALSDEDSPGRDFFPSYGSRAASLQAQMTLSASGSGFMEGPDGQELLVVWESLALKPWTLYATLPARSVKRPIFLANATASAALLAAAFGIAVAIYRARQLRLKNDQLKEAIDELAEAQKLLLRSERSAVLGSAVAGLAHELNTPIGVALTSATFVRDLASSSEGQADPAAAVSEILKASNVLSSSLRRASSIISSFKRVSEAEGDEAPVVLELGQAIEDSVNVLSRPLQDSNAHAVFTRDIPVYVRVSTAALNRVVASIVAGVAAWPSHSTPKLFQVLVSGVDEKALAEFSLHPLPVMAAAGDGPRDLQPAPQRFGAKTIEAGIVKTLVEKDLSGSAVVKSSQDGGFTVTILLERAEEGA